MNGSFCNENSPEWERLRFALTSLESLALAERARHAAVDPLTASAANAVRRNARRIFEYQEILLRRWTPLGRVDALFADIHLLLAPVHPFAAPSLSPHLRVSLVDESDGVVNG